MNRVKLANGVFLTQFEAEKFKRCRVVLHFIWPSKRESATKEAMLPLLMERGYADCPDMTELSKKLANLYGAALSVNLSVVGANRILSVAVSGIKDKYALENEHLSAEYAKIALNVAFKPHLVNGCFDEKNVQIEKEQLRQMLESEINDKRSYCVRQARRKFYADAKEGIERNGYIEDIESLTSENITKAWKDIIENAQMEIMVLGASSKDVENNVINYVESVKRKPTQIIEPNAMPRVTTSEHIEKMDTVQGKLCMLFTMAEPAIGAEFTILRVAVALFGGTATSRLFTNVREKLSLCYYCAAYSDARNGVLCIDSGIDHDKAQAAKQAILKEFDDICNLEITEKELNDTKRYLIERFSSMEDMLDGVEGWHFAQIIKGEEKTIKQMITEIENTTIQQVQQMLKRFTLSTVYLLAKEDNA